MDMKIIGIKQLHKNLKKVSDATAVGQSFLVVKNSKPVFKISPIDGGEGKSYTLGDFGKLQFSSDKNLSKEVDKTVYV